MILLIDNYDSFTYNLYQALGVMYSDIKVIRNDEITIEEIERLSPEAIVISPGPAYPAQAGISEEVIRTFGKNTPILGVCLGHQAIAEAYGGRIVRAEKQLHGKQTLIKIDNSCALFKGLPSQIPVARYHSLIVEKSSLPECFVITAEDSDGQIMGIRHKDHPTYGVQFHPESIMTDTGMSILANFLRAAGVAINAAAASTLPDSKRTELKPYIEKAANGIHLTEQETYNAIDIIMSDRATNAQTTALLTAMRINVETIEEITGCAKAMRQKMSVVKHSVPVLDIVGTGGDLANSFNISTTSAFIISALGQPVAKHGNRSVSSKSGAADVLEALGVKIASTPDKAAECIENTGISFLFAQSYHKAMKFVGPVRSQIGIRTVFNILGPLANPASSEYIVLGVYEERLLEIMAKVLINLGIDRALIVHGDDGLDEFSISSGTTVCEVKNGDITKYSVTPESVGLTRAEKSDIVGGTAADNAKITLGILNGEITGAKRDIVLLNSGAALYVSGKADSIADGVKLARTAVSSGAALKKLHELIEFTNRD